MKDYGSGIYCSKSFPHSFTDGTVIDENSYPSYRRRRNRFTALNRRESITVGNEWVVPYNRFLCKKYKAHINVEVCGTIRAIRYITRLIVNQESLLYDPELGELLLLSQQGDAFAQLARGSYKLAIRPGTKVNMAFLCMNPDGAVYIIRLSN
jgi:hypothetical protein